MTTFFVSRFMSCFLPLFKFPNLFCRDLKHEAHSLFLLSSGDQFGWKLPGCVLDLDLRRKALFLFDVDFTHAFLLANDLDLMA